MRHAPRTSEHLAAGVEEATQRDFAHRAQQVLGLTSGLGPFRATRSSSAPKPSPSSPAAIAAGYGRPWELGRASCRVT